MCSSIARSIEIIVCWAFAASAASMSAITWPTCAATFVSAEGGAVAAVGEAEPDVVVAGVAAGAGAGVGVAGAAAGAGAGVADAGAGAGAAGAGAAGAGAGVADAGAGAGADDALGAVAVTPDIAALNAFMCDRNSLRLAATAGSRPLLGVSPSRPLVPTGVSGAGAASSSPASRSISW